MHAAMLSFLLRLCLLLTVALASAKQNESNDAMVISSKKTSIPHVKGNFIYHYSEGSVCGSLVMLAVGTAMSPKYYNELATNIIQQSPDTVVFIVDNNPCNPIKVDANTFAGISNAIVDQLADLVPVCRSVPNRKIFIGGHSAGGQAVIGAIQQREKLLKYPVAGFIGMAPFDVSKVDNSPIDVPSLQWGFSKTSCGVTYTKAAMLSYQISQPHKGRVFYQVVTHNWNTVSGGPHCSFTDRNCAGMCGGSKSTRAFIHENVGRSVKVLIENAGTAIGIRKSDFEFEMSSSEEVNLFVNEDTVVASSVDGVGAVLTEF